MFMHRGHRKRISLQVLPSTHDYLICDFVYGGGLDPCQQRAYKTCNQLTQILT